MKSNVPVILGLSCFYHDSSAVLLIGGEIIAACQEERFTRKKFDSRFPFDSIEACLSMAGIGSGDIDCVTFYEEPHVKLDRLFETLTSFDPLSPLRNTKKIIKWLKEKFHVEEYVAYCLSDFKGDVLFFNHHLSHAASAFYPSPFRDAAVLTIDGVGEWSCSSISKGGDGVVEVLVEQRFPHSVGLLYSAFTQYIGFKVDSGEYKLMGLAPYGEPTYAKKIKDNLMEIMDDGSIVLNTDYFDFMTGSRMINDRFCSLFGGPAKLPEAEMTVREMDIARSIQEVTEEIILKMVGHAVKLAGSRNLCMAGGVALNCVANGKILRSGLIDRLWVQPAAGDAGGALGAALLCAYEHFKVDRVVASEGDSQKGSLLGPSFKKDEIKRVLDAYGFIYRHLETDRLHVLAAALLAEGKVVGLFQGRMEYGPRALGGRSILGDPRVADMQRKMNLKIKFRESFRPFAPVVLSEKAHQWFDLKQESPYMLLTADVKADHRKSLSVEEESLKGKEKLDVRRSDITAVTHVDYSARVQTLSKDSGGIMRGILEAFDELTGCPVLINTSFNVRGEPIVCTPFDALRCFMNTDIDALVLENFVLIKEEQGGVLVEKDFKGAFEPD